jgi:hypothetical protein
MRIYLRLTVLVVSLILLLGVLLYPEWWYSFLYSGGFRDLSYWTDGSLDALKQIAVAIATLTALLIFMHFVRLARFQDLRLSLQQVIASPRADLSISFLTLAVFVAIAVAVGTLGDRFVSGPSRVTGLFTIATVDPGVTPTTFLYIDNDAIEKLSGQYEPELVPETVVAEIKSSSDIKVGASVEEFLKTEVGRSELQRKMTEYKKLVKTPERKLKDLLPYLAQHQLMQRFWGTLNDPEEVNRLDQAALVLKGQGVKTDAKQLAAAREKILAEQLRKLEEKLRALQGLVLVEGEWSVQGRGDRYVFTKPFVENVTHSSMAEFSVKKSDIPAGYGAIIDGSKGRALRLRLFGNVLLGTADAPGIIVIEPEGLYL